MLRFLVVCLIIINNNKKTRLNKFNIMYDDDA